jgi:hypothetical protein
VRRSIGVSRGRELRDEQKMRARFGGRGVG